VPPDASAAAMTPQTAAYEGQATGKALRQLGINTDLAPVTDTAYTGGFLGTRTFSADPARVAVDACEFADGLESAGVDATFKHFPGLGAAMTDTDTTMTTVNLSSGALSADLAPYRRCLPRLVMVSNAIYPAWDPTRPAVFSPTIVQGVLRDQLGFRGVTISDTLTAPGVASTAAPARASVAGIDILLYTNERASAQAFHELLTEVQNREVGRQQIIQSALRINTLRSVLATRRVDTPVRRDQMIVTGAGHG